MNDIGVNISKIALQFNPFLHLYVVLQKPKNEGKWINKKFGSIMLLLTGPPSSNSSVIAKTANGGATIRKKKKKNPITSVGAHPYVKTD